MFRDAYQGFESEDDLDFEETSSCKWKQVSGKEILVPGCSKGSFGKFDKKLTSDDYLRPGTSTDRRNVRSVSPATDIDYMTDEPNC